MKTKKAQRKYNREWFRNWYNKKKAVITALKAFPCMDCGGTFPPECMDFDHVRGNKQFTISRTKGIEAALAEIKKCDLVCSNCHRIRTQVRRSKQDS